MLKIGLGAIWVMAYLHAQTPVQSVQSPVQSPVQGSGSVQGSIAASTGVYTEAQATRGKDIFGSICTSCHNISSQSGATFSKRWNGAPVSDLYQVMTETMPKDDPGSLPEKDRVDVIAYLLKINALPAGKDDLPADPEQLKKIIIDLVK